MTFVGVAMSEESPRKPSDDGAQSRALKSVRLARDDAYFALDEEGASDLQQRLAESLRKDAEAGTKGDGAPTALPRVLAIGVPGVIALDRRDAIPVVLALRATGLREWQVRAALNLRLVATDLRTGQVRTARLEATYRRKPPARPSLAGTPPDATNAATVSVQLNRRDVRALPGLAWHAGRYALTVIDHDWVSNTAVVDLRGKLEGSAAAAIADSVRASPTAIVEARPPSPGNGVSLTVPGRAAARTALSFLGSLRLPTVDLVWKAAERERGKASSVMASLLLVKLDADEPIQLEVALPVRRVGGTGPKALVEAGFSIDVHLPPDLAPPGSYQVYLVTGPHVAGPYPLVIAAE